MKRFLAATALIFVMCSAAFGNRLLIMGNMATPMAQTSSALIQTLQLSNITLTPLGHDDAIRAIKEVKRGDLILLPCFIGRKAEPLKEIAPVYMPLNVFVATVKSDIKSLADVKKKHRVIAGSTLPPFDEAIRDLIFISGLTSFTPVKTAGMMEAWQLILNEKVDLFPFGILDFYAWKIPAYRQKIRAIPFWNDERYEKSRKIFNGRIEVTVHDSDGLKTMFASYQLFGLYCLKEDYDSLSFIRKKLEEKFEEYVKASGAFPKADPSFLNL